MATSFYLINPKAEHPGYYTAESFSSRGLPPTVVFPDLSIVTVAALVPDDFDLELCEEQVDAVNFDHHAEFIGITGKDTQFSGMIAIAEEFRRRGKTVIIGGPLASLEPEAVRPHCDILVEGELEEIADEFFSDLRNGNWKDSYKGTRPSLTTSPMPRWDLYPNDSAVLGAVQTSRGCPFDCEFCDVIQYLGRTQRHKEPEQVVAELDVLYDYGYRVIFLSDDNFTVYRRRAKELLLELKAWNASRPDGSVAFTTQLSIDAALDEEMLQLCAEAGLMSAFIGIETPNEESLKESRKRHNLSGTTTIVEKLELFAQHGIMVVGGMIVGFDSDDTSIFDLQYRFAMDTPVPIYTLNALVAPAATPLFDRMKDAGRLIERDDGGDSNVFPWLTNIIPAGMTSDELETGVRWLANNLYSVESYEQRLFQFIELHGQALDGIPEVMRNHKPVNRPAVKSTERIVREFSSFGPAEADLWARVVATLSEKPWLAVPVITSISQYMQVRHMFANGRFWDPQLAKSAPQFNVSAASVLSLDDVQFSGGIFG